MFIHAKAKTALTDTVAERRGMSWKSFITYKLTGAAAAFTPNLDTKSLGSES